MNRSLLSAAFAAALVCGAGTIQAASFTYHGNLQDSGKPADGSYDIELTLYSAPTGGGVIGGPLVMYKVPVHGGSFSTQADFGPLTKASSQAYVAVRVRTAGNGEFAALSARSPMTVDATTSVCPGAWTLAGNAGNPAGSYLGTADTQPLTFEVNATQVGQITPTGAPLTTSTSNVVFGSSSNNVAGGVGGATIAGGGDAAATCGSSGTTSCANSVQSDFATVSGGEQNTASGFGSIVGGGYQNTASGGGAVVASGYGNVASGGDSAVGGGAVNTASGYNATVGGGTSNTASGYNAMVAGGRNNVAGGDHSFSAGVKATVRDASSTPGCTVSLNCGDYGTFVWADDSSTGNFTSTGPNQFLIRANGGMAINGTPVNHNDELTIYGNGNGSNNVDVDLFPFGATQGFELLVVGGSSTDPTFRIDQTDGVSTFVQRLQIAATTGFVGLNGGGSTYPLAVGTDTSNGDGAHLTAGGVWTIGSSRTFKDDVAHIDVGGVLAKVLELPVQTWFYKNDHQEGRHMGPMAEDFAQAFGLGDNERYIATVDEEGVAFAAIQGLNQKVETENALLKQENVELRGKLDEVLARLNRVEAKQGE